MNDDRAIPTLSAAAPSANGELLNRVQQLRLDNQLTATAKRGGGGAGWLPWVLCALMAGAWALLGVRGYRAPADGAAAGPEVPVASAPAATGTTGGSPAGPAVEVGSIQLEVKGYLMPAVQVAVSPIDVAGQLIALDIKEGEFYPKDSLLAKIDATNYRFTVQDAEQALVAAREKLQASLRRRDELMPASVRQIEKDQVVAQIDEAKAQKARTDNELTRTEQIRTSVTAREYDQVRNDALAANARLEKLNIDLKILETGPRKERVAAADADVAGAEADIKAAQAKLASANWRLANCDIRAPIAGTVLTKKSEKGNLVNPLAFAGGSGSVCDMADLSDLEADLEIPERDIAKLKVGQACRVKADAYPDRLYAGRLDRIMPIANRAKSIVNVRVKVTLPADEKPGTYLKPEMGAVVSFLPAAAK